jgi:hypothetical protein
MLRALRPILGTPAPLAPVPLPSGVELRHGRWVPALGGLFTTSRRAAAVTLGDTIVVHPDVPLSPRLLRHELAHVQQWRAQPWSFMWRYAWYHLRFGYRDNPYEVAARAAEHDHADA